MSQQRFIALVYIFLLALLFILATSILRDEVREAMTQPWLAVGWRVLGNGGGAAIVLLIEAAYVYAFIKQPYDALAPLSFLFSYLIGGFVTKIVLESLGKADSMQDLRIGLLYSLVFVIPTVLVVGTAIAWTYKRARTPDAGGA